jgi:protease I
MSLGARLCFTGAMHRTLLAFVEDVYEDLELWYPKLRLEEAGFTTRLAGPQLKTYTGKHGYPAAADALLSEVHSADFSGLLIPGGFMPDKLRRDPRVLELTREFFEQGKLVAFICHGGWIPISARILKDKHATGSLGIRDDLENAGALWVDAPVVIDGNLVSSRTPRDLPQFAQAIVQFLAPAPVATPPPGPMSPKPSPPKDALHKVFELNPKMAKKF